MDVLLLCADIHSIVVASCKRILETVSSFCEQNVFLRLIMAGISSTNAITNDLYECF